MARHCCKKENGFRVTTAWRQNINWNVGGIKLALIGFEAVSIANNQHYLFYCIIIIIIQHHCRETLFLKEDHLKMLLERFVCKRLLLLRKTEEEVCYMPLLFSIPDSAQFICYSYCKECTIWICLLPVCCLFPDLHFVLIISDDL